MAKMNKVKLPSGEYVPINDERIHIYRSLTGTAAVTASPYTHAKWDVSDSTITQYVDGMVVCIKVPVAGHGTYGTGLQINNLGYKPVVYNVNSMIGTRYSVGAVVWAVYNSTQTASMYVNSASASTITGCWQVMDYDTNTTSIYTLQRYNGTRVVSADLLRYVIAFRKNETTIVPIHSVAGTGTSANTAVTSTNKTMTTESFDPFGEIYQYATNTKIAANGSVNLSTLRTQCASVDARYIFNCNKTLTAQRELYLVVDLQSDGMVKLATSVNPWAQTLPSTNDGHLYILLGYAYSTYQMELYYYHPIYYHDGTKIAMWTGAAAESDLFDCVMTQENSVWSCDHTWAEIYAAHQAGKLVRLTKSNGEIYMPEFIGSDGGKFSACLHISIGTFIESSGIQSFIYDSSGDLMPLGWSLHQTIFRAFTDAYKTKLDGIAAGAQVNVKPDWNAESGSSAEILNKPTIPDAVSGTNDGTNWTSLTIGNTTKAIPSGGTQETIKKFTRNGMTFHMSVSPSGSGSVTCNGLSDGGSGLIVPVNDSGNAVATLVATAASGYNFSKWQTSSNGSTWTDVSGGTTETLSVSKSSGTEYYYRAVFNSPLQTILIDAVDGNQNPFDEYGGDINDMVTIEDSNGIRYTIVNGYIHVPENSTLTIYLSSCGMGAPTINPTGFEAQANDIYYHLVSGDSFTIGEDTTFIKVEVYLDWM